MVGHELHRRALALTDHHAPIRSQRVHQRTDYRGAQLAMYEQQLADVGVGSDRWRGLRDERETFLERAPEAEAERRREALCSELRRRGRMTFDGLADKYVDELADSAPKGDQAGGG